MVASELLARAPMSRWMMVVILVLIAYLAIQAACGPAVGPALGLGPQFDRLAGLILIVLVAAVALDLMKGK